MGESDLSAWDARGAVAPIAGGAIRAAAHNAAGRDGTVVQPLGGPAVHITGGLLGTWQRRNRETTIPHVIARLRAAGNLTNLSRLLDDHPTPYQGRYPFGDTDLYKTLEGLAYELAAGEDAAIRGFFDEVVGLLETVQAEDGYLNSRFQDPDFTAAPWSDLAWGHELYNLGHLIQAALAAHRQLGDDRLLRVAIRFADLVVRRFGPDGGAGKPSGVLSDNTDGGAVQPSGKTDDQSAVCGHPEVEMALVELYRVTGNTGYLRQAQLFLDRRGHGHIGLRTLPPEYAQDHVPFRQMSSVTGHAVRMTYLAAGAADIWLETGEDALGQALGTLWDDLVSRKLYLTGGLGSRHSDEAIGDGYELPAERAYAETCAAIGTMQWAWRMFLGTGAARYLDVFETVLYNAFAVGVSLDGAAFFYDNPLQRRPDHGQRSGAEIGGAPLRRAWFGCPCCPPNVVRWMSQLGDYLAARTDDVLYLANYANATIDATGPDGGGIAVTATTDYPWSGEIRLRIDRAPDNGMHAIALRIPQWVNGAGGPVTLDGEPVAWADGWLTVSRRWAVGDTVTLGLPMPVRAHGSHPYLDATRGALAVARGPIVYAVEQPDCAVPVDDLVLDVDQVHGATITPGPANLPGCVAIAARGRAVPPATAELYPQLPTTPASGGPAPVTLIPYFLWGNRDPGPMRVWIRRR